MNTINLNLNLNFKSKINPVKPYKFKTNLGEIYISEVNLEKEATPKLMHKVNKFFCKNFARDTKDKEYTIYETGTPQEKKKFENEFYLYYKNIIKRNSLKDNITLLIAKDTKNEIQGACLSHPNFIIPKSSKTTLWIDALAVNREYRNLNIARELMQKTLDANKNSFTDAFLTGTIFAIKFYEKLGFKVLNKKNKNEKIIYNYLEQTRYDIPEHVLPMTKVLQENKPRWYEASAKAIRQHQLLSF